MKVATVIFERVRDCPHWDGKDSECGKTDEVSCSSNGNVLPPHNCPLEDIEDCR